MVAMVTMNADCMGCSNMSPFVYQRIWLTVMVLATCFTGCTKSHSLGDSAGVETSQAKEDPMHCHDQCIAASLKFAAGELGLDPSEAESISKDGNLQTVFAALQSRGGSGIGRLESVPLGRFLHEQESNGESIPPTILVHESGHLSCVLGKLSREGKQFYQLLHGDTKPYLFAASQLKEAGFRDAWIVKREYFSGVPIRVGSGTVRINSLWHTFGEVRPFGVEVTEFVITNDGREVIVLDKPKTSCGCAVADFGNTNSLRPGESAPMKVTIQTGGVPSMRQAIWLQFFERSTGASRRLGLQVFAFQRQFMIVSPNELDFGTIAPSNEHEKPSRTVRLVEVPTDRFRMEGIGVGTLPIEYAVSESKTPDGMTSYRLTLALNAKDSQAGEHSGTIQVKTNSTLRPTVSIPVRFRIKPRVTAVPETLTFGAPYVGVTLEQRFRLSLRTDGETLSVTDIEAPKECSVAPIEDGNQREFLVKARFMEAGVWEGVIKLHVQSATWSETVEVSCVAYVRRENHLSRAGCHPSGKENCYETQSCGSCGDFGRVLGHCSDYTASSGL